MNTHLVPFEYQDKPVRVVLQDETPWWIAKDVCDVLTISNSRDALASLDDDEKGVVTTDTPGGQQQMNAVSESGLYNLIFQSRKPEAKTFRKWVTSEVLPQIRKTGRFEAGESAETPRAFNATEEIQFLKASRAEKDRIIAELRKDVLVRDKLIAHIEYEHKQLLYVHGLVQNSVYGDPDYPGDEG